MPSLKRAQTHCQVRLRRETLLTSCGLSLRLGHESPAKGRPAKGSLKRPKATWGVAQNYTAGVTQVLAHVSTYQGNPFWNSGFLSHSHIFATRRRRGDQHPSADRKPHRGGGCSRGLDFGSGSARGTFSRNMLHVLAVPSRLLRVLGL